MTKKLEDRTEKYLMDNYVDICGGIMTLKDINREIFHYAHYKAGISRSPKELVVHIKRIDLGYYTTIYVKKSDFKSKSILEDGK